MKRLVSTMFAVAATIALATPTFAGTLNNISVTPTTLSITAGSSGTYSLAVTNISGKIPSQPPESPAITYCSVWTIHANGSVTCDQTAQILLESPRNYSQLPLTADDVAALTRTVTVNVDAALCDQSFQIPVTTAVPDGSGVDFGGGAHTYTWATVTVNVTCADSGGCSHGYWKNHESEWPTPYTPGTALGSVFTMGQTYGTISGSTFSQALAFGGGPKVVDKAKLLMVQAVAALLNAAQEGVNYPLSQADIISQVNTALASADPEQLLSLQGALDGYNNLHGSFCPTDEQP